jgi:hypothetical protein
MVPQAAVLYEKLRFTNHKIDPAKGTSFSITLGATSRSPAIGQLHPKP